MLNVFNQLSARAVLIVTLLLTVSVGIGFAQPVTGATDKDDEAAVRDALLKSALSFEKNDLALATEVWANDESLTVFEQGHANYGWADYRDNHLVPEMKEMKNTRYALSDIRVKLAGATAWATFKYSIFADIESRHVEGSGLGTAVLEKRQGRWQIVHWHSSAPRRAPAVTSSPVKKD